ncbi:MAG: SIS domain-containing protein [Jatrophihabitantaceae bacterium]
MTGGAMQHELAEQPAVLARLIAGWDENQCRIREVLPAQLRGIVFVARGSSDNVAVLGRYAAELGTELPVSLAAPSLRTRYGPRAGLADHLIVALSQSGEVPEIVHAATGLRGAGSRLLAITNDPASALADAADLTLALGAGPERAVPATKTVTAQLVLVLAVAAALAAVCGNGPIVTRRELDRVPAAVGALVLDDGAPRRLAERWRRRNTLQVVGRGLAYGAILEVAIKIRETTGVFAQGISSADLVHGPIAALSSRTPVLAVATGGPADPEPALWQRVRDTGADVATCTPDPRSDLPLAPDLPELLQGVAVIVRGQQLASAWARARGLDPDAPAGLTKVTATV